MLSAFEQIVSSKADIIHQPFLWILTVCFWVQILAHQDYEYLLSLPVPICFQKQHPNHGTHTLAAYTMRILINYGFLHASSESSHNAEFLLNAVSGLSTVTAIVQECNQIAGNGKLLESGRPRVEDIERLGYGQDYCKD